MTGCGGVLEATSESQTLAPSWDPVQSGLPEDEVPYDMNCR